MNRDRGVVIPTNVRQAYQAGYEAGLQAEVTARDQGLNREHRSLRSYIETLARAGRDVDSVVASSAVVFTAGWPLLERFWLAWRLVRR
jgi:hypothetical protein